MYVERFKGLLITTAKGYGIGAVVALVLMLVTQMAKSAGSFIGLFIVFTILFGSIVSIIICAKTGAQGYMSGAVSRLWTGIKGVFFGSILGLNPFLMLFGIVKFLIGLIIMIPVGIYMCISYFLNLIYLGIMAVLEKNGKLDNKEDLCETLDKVVSVVSLVIVIILCIMIVISL